VTTGFQVTFDAADARAWAGSGPGVGSATELREGDENGEYWIVLHDIEGNEFCVQ
jgi:hypothetical protein